MPGHVNKTVHRGVVDYEVVGKNASSHPSLLIQLLHPLVN